MTDIRVGLNDALMSVDILFLFSVAHADPWKVSPET